MGDGEQTTEVIIGFRFRNDALPDVVRILGEHSVGDAEVRLGQGEFGFLEKMDWEALSRRITLDGMRQFYSNRFRDDRPSSIATRVFNTIAGQVDPNSVTFEKDDPERPAVAVARLQWDEEVQRIFDGTSVIKWRSTTKSRRLLSAFTDHLPPAHKEKKTKRSK